MRLIFWLFVAAAALLAATPLPAVAAPASASAPVVPPLDHRARTLANGARIYTIRDTTASTASVNVWYMVGQRDDPRERGGFAHLFEHLMFKSTRNLPAGVAPFVTSIGGSSNASTLFDYTAYYVTAPAERLEALIWLEGERLRNLVVDEANFASERDVVKEELRQRIFAQPYGRILYTLLPAFTFSAHPYARPIGGTIADLDAATLDDVRAFHEAYYRPDNAIFVVSGNFDPAQVDAWIDLHIGSIARPSRPIPRDARGETEPMQPRTVDAYAPNVPLPAVIFSWRAPDADDPDAAGLAFVEAVLTRGSAARLRRRLVDELQLASNVSSFNLPARDGHAFALVVTLAQGRDVAEAEAALAAELARLRDEPMGASELAAFKNAVLGDALLRRETARGRAFELGGGVALNGDPAFEDRRLQAIAALSAADVQRVAGRRLGEAGRVTLRYRDESQRPAGYAGDTPPDVSEMGTIVPPAARPPVTLASEAERQGPPAPAAAVPRHAPQPVERQLANGLRLVAARSSDVPLVTLKLVLGGGDAADPAGKAGLADVMAEAALRGAGGRDAAEIAEAIAALGGSISAAADADAVTFSVTVPAANAEPAGRVLADIVRLPAFAEADLERVRRQQIDALAVAARQPTQTAVRVLARAMFGQSPYGAVPTTASLGSIARADLVAAHARSWTPGNATLVVTGALGPDAAAALAERLFGNWPAATEPAPVPASSAHAPPQVVAVDLPGAGQTAVLAAVHAPGRGAPDWPALRIANARLGGGMQGLLSQEIRVRRGLSYGAGSLLDPRADGMLLIAVTQTRNDAAVEVAGLVLDQFRRLSSEPMAPDQLAERAEFLTNALSSQTERTAGLADYLASLVVAQTPLETARAELLGEPAVTPEGVSAVAARHLRPDAATLVIVGDSRQWIEPMRQRFPQLRVVTPE